MSTAQAAASLHFPDVAAPPAPPLSPVETPTAAPSRAVAEPIGRLPSEWTQLHDVSIAGDRIDTLLIGPNGCFAVHVDPDLRPAAVRPGLGLLRSGARQPEPVKRALRNTEALRRQLAHLPGDLFPYPVLVTATPGAAGHRLGRLLVVRPGRLAEALWQHVSRPLRRSERSAIHAELA